MPLNDCLWNSRIRPKFETVWSNSFLLTFNYRKCEKSINSTKDIVLEIPPINPLGVNSTKWSNTLKQFFGNSRRIVWVCLTIFQVGALKCYLKKILVRHYSASINLTQQCISISLRNSPRHLATANITAEVLHTFHCFMFFTSNDFD